MTGRCGFTGCENAARHVCGHCGMPLCEAHAVAEAGANGEATAYCPQCRDYLRAKSGDGAARGIGREGVSGAET